MKIHELLEQRAKKIAEMRTLQTTADTANRDLSDNERQRFDQIETEVRAINEKIERAQRLDALERSAAATPTLTANAARLVFSWTPSLRVQVSKAAILAAFAKSARNCSAGPDAPQRAS